ncbi:MAG TPA: SBBP repeat-containing protein, partial [Candidatus Hydrogenedentes bacterium]|nr:SBBP repeat-containing protein [Candidatus Hydrogenedentota bacterium]
MSGTYVGGGLEDVCAAVATDGGGNVYVAGHTGSSGWVDGGGDTTQNGQRDAFVVKFSPSGDHLWSTFLGGESEDDASGIALDGAGNVLVSGSTSSSGWVSGGWDVVRNRGWDGDPQWPRDGFVVKLSPAGAHVWSSYLGGANDDLAHDIAVDAWGGVCVVGATVSPGWVSGGWRPVFGGSVWEDGFLVKLSSAGAHQWSTFMGGGGDDYAHSVTTSSGGDILVAGATKSPGWVSGGWNTTYNAGGNGYDTGHSDAFAVRFSPSGAHLWSTYLGEAGQDVGRGIAEAPGGDVIV